jgi:4a-hydroxytetrahydrobiopterin dehydratase
MCSDVLDDRESSTGFQEPVPEPKRLFGVISGGWTASLGTRSITGKAAIFLAGTRRTDVSEQGWREFLAADGVDDWVVLHGGGTAVFRVASIREAARLAAAVTAVEALDGSGALLTISDTHLSVRITRDLWSIEARHVDLARGISDVAREHGAVADRSAAQEVQFAIAAKPDDIDVGFWRAALGYDAMADDNGVDPLGHGSTVWLQELDTARPLRHAMHVDVSVAREQVEARLEAALAAGGRIVDESEEHWTLSDRAGNRVCICAWPDGHVNRRSRSAYGAFDHGE